MKFNELKDLLNKEFGIIHLADIARELGVTPQAVSNWKARDRVPYKYVQQLRNKLSQLESKDSSIDKNVSYRNKEIVKNDFTNYFEDETISLSDLFLIIAKNLKIIILTPVTLCIFMSIYLFFIAEPVFESTAKIMSSSGNNSTSQASGLAAQFGIVLPTGDSKPEWVYPEIIRSRTLARKMLQRKFKTKKNGVEKTLLNILSQTNNKSDEINDNQIRSAIEQVTNMIKIEQNGTHYDLTVSAPEPELAKDFATFLLEELDDYQRLYNKQKTSDTKEFIEERIAKTKIELEAAEEALKDFNNRNRRIENSPGLQLERQRLAREVSVLIGVFTTLKQQFETTKIEEVKDTEYVIILDPPEVPSYRSRPKRKMMLILSIILGIGLGIIFSFIKESSKAEEKEQKKIHQAKSLFIKNIFDLLSFKLKNR
ncbi:MAG: hypothetical protein CMG57_09655 [Candidatus Marinimicrobia bacterium]|nr:hypothetical protein [Candidatus Neomarinimicrobiota bacterium]|tara:strand:- start:4507 stop:5784 length:1278 start_codon:yes stop_codon:yes gene_type:complete